MFDTKSKLMVAAIGAAFALPMAAQAQTNVTVYGKMYPDISHLNISGATPTGSANSSLSATAKGTNNSSVTAEDAVNSRLGFKGTEDLGGGMQAIFQLEMGFSLDTGATSDATGIPFSRNTFVGLTGGWGTIRLGNMDTVYKELGDQMPFLGITSGNFMSTSNILSKPTFTTNSASSFHLRRTNSVYYTSPNFGGVTGLFDWSPQEVAGDSTAGVISTGFKYEAGPIYAAVAYEIHKDLYGGSFGTFGNAGGIGNANNISSATSTTAVTPGVTSKDQAVRVTLQYSFPDNWKAELDVARLQYAESGQAAAGKFNTYKHNTWAIGVEKDIGAVSLVGSYGREGAGSCTLSGGVACSTGGLNAQMLNLGVGYALSKRTQLYGVYSYIGNDSSAVTSNIVATGAKPTNGQDIQTVAVGMSHSF